MINRRVGQNAVAKIEDMGPILEGGENIFHSGLQCSTASDESQRIKIALYRKPHGQNGVCPMRINSLIDPNPVHARFLRIGTKLAPCSLGHANDWNARAAPAYRIDNGNRKSVGQGKVGS